MYQRYRNKNWLQFLFIVKATVLKQQISKFYPQIQRTEASDHINFSQRPVINVKAIFCASEPQGSKFGLSHYFGYSLLQQLVLPYKP